MESILAYMERYDYENLFICQDKAVGLRAVIAIHDTTLGPATGGTRMWTFPSEMEAIEDALRLARGMTYKYAAAGVNLGGGKCVVIGDPRREKSEMLFRALGRFINRLGGIYITGEDVGTTLREMEYMRMETPYVVTLPASWGGAGPIGGATAFGVVQGMKACTKAVYDNDSLEGRTVTIQGLGAVGSEVVPLLVKEGARVVVTDIDPEKVEAMAGRFSVTSVHPDEIIGRDADIFCPCALGGVINTQTLSQFKVKIVCGSANNQLREERDGQEIEARGILYAPDYIVNAGGTIFDTDRLNPGGFNRERAMTNVSRIYETMSSLIRVSREERIPTYRAADLLAERRIEAVRKAKLLAARGEVRM
ncbi:MAG TPA: Glu/Leu/Phe/Val dehydrogenase dimerization domain-containing protein [bacterium]|nr:Glu/Leu/Phe/Val dehydrogenase dimerization domain-containing protein [bacterium]